MLNSVWDHDPEAYAKLRQCWLNTRRQAYISKALEKLDTGDLVLEVGSGTGNLLIELASKSPDLSFIGVDPLTPYVEFATNQAILRSLANVRFFTSTGEDIDKTIKQTCRLILSNDVIHHVNDEAALSHAIFALSSKETEWIAIEPNCLNPYTFWKQATGAGEKNFYPRSFLNKASDWICQSKEHLFLIPPFLKDPPGFLKMIERKLEWVPCTAGGVVLRLKPKFN